MRAINEVKKAGCIRALVDSGRIRNGIMHALTASGTPYVFAGSIHQIATICVDPTEFLVSKLKDRGTHQAFGVVTNAQDFMRLLQLELTARVRATS